MDSKISIIMPGGVLCSFLESTYPPTGTLTCKCKCTALDPKSGNALDPNSGNARFSKFVPWIPHAYTLKDNGIELFSNEHTDTISPNLFLGNNEQEQEQYLKDAFRKFEALMNADFQTFQWGQHSISSYNVRRQPFGYFHTDPWKWKDVTQVVNEWFPIQESKTLVILDHKQQDHWNSDPSEYENMISLKDMETYLQDEQYELMAVPPGHCVRFISNKLYHAAIDLPGSTAPSCSYELRVSGTPHTIKWSL